jgi:hypothetical protein
MFTNKFCRTLFLGVFFAGAVFAAHAQLDRGELERNQAPVRFLNYEGPTAVNNTREQIRQIGVGLGSAVRTGRAGASNRYFVIHSVSAAEGDKLDADILGLGADAGVEHIRNVRTIIQGYLQEAYGYSAADALLLAQYITVYNAVYRGNWDYYAGRYKTPVLGHLTPRQNAGISVRFDEWPGRTLMVIPLGIGGLSSIDTSTISDGRVIDEMRKDDDRGIPERQGMVDLKEREADAAERRAADQRAQAERDRQQAERDRAQAERDRQQAQRDRESGAISQQEADRRQAEADKKTEELDRRDAEIARQKEEADKLDQFAEDKFGEAQKDREGIATDQQSRIDQEDAAQGGLIAVAIEPRDSVMGRLVTLDATTGRELLRSPLNTVYVRTITFINGKVLAVAGENRGNAAIRLIEINTRSLEMAKQGDDDIHANSLIWVNGSDIYAITANLSDGTLNLGRFNTDLVLQAKSAIAVNPNASVSVQQGSLLTQKADGSAAVLNPSDLREKR